MSLYKYSNYRMMSLLAVYTFSYLYHYGRSMSNILYLYDSEK